MTSARCSNGVPTTSPTKALAASTKYMVVLGGAIKDRAVNVVAAVRWSFTTSR